MPWYFVIFTWVVLTGSFHTAGVWIFNRMHRYFPLKWYEVSYIMAAAVLIWWLVVNSFAYPVLR